MDKIYVKGIRIFNPHDNAPDFVKGTVIITPRELTDFLKSQADNFTEYEGTKQLRCQLLEGKKGLYLAVDTFKKEEKAQPAQKPEPDESLPF